MTKTQTLILSGQLPGRNKAEEAARSHWSQAAKLKAQNTEAVAWQVMASMIKPVVGKAEIVVTFYEKDERRDADNIIGGGLKYILDGLVLAGVIVDDGRKYVNLAVNPIKTDRNNPRIEIIITGETA